MSERKEYAVRVRQTIVYEDVVYVFADSKEDASESAKMASWPADDCSHAGPEEVLDVVRIQDEEGNHVNEL